MSFNWLSRRSGAKSPSVPRSDLLEEARALARAGKLQEASATYWKIKQKQHTAASLLEHAQILFDFGDHFGAASKAAAALRLEPQNADARAIQDRIRRIEAGRGR